MLPDLSDHKEIARIFFCRLGEVTSIIWMEPEIWLYTANVMFCADKTLLFFFILEKRLAIPTSFFIY